MKITLKSKLIGSSLLAVVAMASALTWLASHRLYEQTQAAIYNRTTSLAKATASSISDWVAIRESIAQSFNDHTQEADVIPFLQQSRNAGGFDDIFFGTTQGEMLRSHPERNRAGYDPRQRPWYQDAKSAGKQIITTAYQDAITNALLITIAEPINKQGQFIGVVGADVLIDQLVEDVIALDAGVNANTMLIDAQNGTFLAHQNSELILKPVSELSSNLSMPNIKQAATDSVLESVDVAGVEKLMLFKKVPNTDWYFAIELDKSTELQSFYQLLKGLIFTASIIALAVFGLVSWLVNFLFRDLGRVSKALEEIASGDGDLTQTITPRFDDEVGQLARNFNVFVENMRTLVIQLHSVAGELSEQSRATANQAKERSERIGLQQDEINMVATAINEMSAATHEIANNADNAAHSATQAVSTSVNGSAQVGQTQASIQNLAKEVQIATDVIQELNGHSQSISTILGTITDIAEQTNLLALNAAIEAARAGEQGRGFAVVADEVRVLSQRTHASTKEIQTMIETLQSTTGKAVTIMDDSRNLANTSVADAEQAAHNLEQIKSAIELISDMATQIATAAEEQASVTSEVTRNTQGIRDVSNDLSDEAVQAAEQAGKLSALSDQLHGHIQRFKL
ncbi:methyl-accepting chemotaxis protein [Vibrio olivae]|uniref:Methyl-accepting chemotaxis protein n=1 Tax=Vibrio olivae TaxID=1243002 RepID=A0ABV5HJB1_9VIBR